MIHAPIAKQCWFPTLTQALYAEGVNRLWQVGLDIRYGETQSCVKNGTYVSVTRDEIGRYERAITYKTQREDTW